MLSYVVIVNSHTVSVRVKSGRMGMEEEKGQEKMGGGNKRQ